MAVVYMLCGVVLFMIHNAVYFEKLFPLLYSNLCTLLSSTESI